MMFLLKELIFRVAMLVFLGDNPHGPPPKIPQWPPKAVDEYATNLKLFRVRFCLGIQLSIIMVYLLQEGY